MKRIIRILSLILTVLVLMSDRVYVQGAGIEDRVRDYIDEFRTQTKCTAVSVAIVRGEETYFYGDDEGLFRIGSMTKAFTALAVRKLISEGELFEDDTVSAVLPGFTVTFENEPCDITIGQLLTQTGGFTNNEKVYPSATGTTTLMEWVDSMSGRELAFRPGTEYAYSNANYNLLGAVIEQVSGISFAEYMEKEILTPLGLENTYVQVPEGTQNIIRGSRLGYRCSFEYDIPVAPGRIPAGYFYSNAEDMARWIRIWLGTADIPEEYRGLVREIKDELTDTGDYTYGWELFENGTIGHSGGTPDHSSRIVFSEENRIGVCVLTNMNVAASTDSLCNGIYSLCIGEGKEPLSTDVWTVFDLVFTALTAVCAAVLLLTVFVKRRRVLLAAGCIMLILLILLCTVMPAVFGAGLRDIMFIWAPLSFAGGIFVLAIDLIVTVIRLWMMRNDN